MSLLVARPGLVPAASVDALWVSDGRGVHAEGEIPCALHPLVATDSHAEGTISLRRCANRPPSPPLGCLAPLVSARFNGTLDVVW